MTNPVLTAISERRSIRQYKPEQITEEQLQVSYGPPCSPLARAICSPGTSPCCRTPPFSPKSTGGHGHPGPRG